MVDDDTCAQFPKWARKRTTTEKLRVEIVNGMQWNKMELFLLLCCSFWWSFFFVFINNTAAYKIGHLNCKLWLLMILHSVYPLIWIYFRNKSCGILFDWLIADKRFRSLITGIIATIWAILIELTFVLIGMHLSYIFHTRPVTTHTPWPASHFAFCILQYSEVCTVHVRNYYYNAVEACNELIFVRHENHFDVHWCWHCWQWLSMPFLRLLLLGCCLPCIRKWARQRRTISTTWRLGRANTFPFSLMPLFLVAIALIVNRNCKNWASERVSALTSMFAAVFFY